MNPLPIRTLVASLLISSAASAVGSENGQRAKHYELSMLAAATTRSCADHSFRTQLRLCDDDGCTSMDVTNLPSVDFVLEPQHNATLTTSVAYEVDGKVFGSSESHELDAAAESRFAQTVTGGGSCVRNVYYELRARE